MPLAQQLLLDLVMPPVLAGITWFLGSGWLALVWGGRPSEQTKKWSKAAVLLVLVGGYVLMFSITLYGHLSR